MSDVVKNHLAHAEAALNAHRDFEERIQQVVAIADTWIRRGARAPEILQIALTLSQFRHSLLCHFIWEECDGYMDPVLRRDPSRYVQIDRLRREHDQMRRMMAALHRDAILAGYGGPVDLDEYPRRLLAFVNTLRHHEILERELVQECFYRDVGEGD